ncbi:MBL fold metallo-hydrolase [Loktanella agnita]|uniref:MBL fold metallo-hydrolase n=1 Tax=Loktanella agnita TaxID=287097 RepID=UPI0039886576
MQNPQRAQPAHVLMNGDRPILIDCGEGAMGQLKRAGIEYRDVHHIFLTHHHFDHIGSLYACLGLNMMTQRREPLCIYGPAGTQAIVDGLCAACDVPNAIGFGVPGQQLPHPRDFVEVTEITPGDEITLDGLKMTCCENTHYRTEDQFGEDGYHSLSLRFDLDDRSVVFTGDTGPCDALVTLSQGADLIVGEMMDLDITMGRIRAMNQGMPEDRIEMIKNHLSKHHINAEDLAHLAKSASAKEVVAVHFPPGIATPDTAQGYVDRVAAIFDGKFLIGQDLAAY